MCGIAGTIGLAASRVSGDWEGIRDRLAHRGPDGAGHWKASRVTLLHTRLAIIDLAHGAQPMQTQDGLYVISYNGEIYNFRELRSELESLGASFLTDSDTEVALEAYRHWGVNCFLKFRGMFAMCIHDVKREEAVLVRDPFGVKPLVYTQADDGFHFASELHALVAFPGVDTRISPDAIDQYFNFGYIAAPDTIYQGVKKLEPGHWIRVDRNGAVLERQCYWEPVFKPEYGRSSEEWLECIDAAVSTAVKRSLVADVPFGLFLSGGIDSSLVATRMRRLMDSPIQAFCIGFEEEQYDESSSARAIAEFLEIPIDVKKVNGQDVANLEELVAAYGEPFSDASAVPTWSLCRQAREKFPMVLAGDGGDELFGGYARYDHWVENEWRTRKGLVRQLQHGRLLQAAGSTGRVLRQRHDGGEWRQYIELFSTKERERLLGRASRRNAAAAFRQAHLRYRGERALSYVQAMDMKTYLPGAVLTKVDIASMSCGLEVRPPLLDLDLAELACRIPDELQRDKTRPLGLQGKALLKELLGREIPRELWDRSKQGFGLSHEVGFAEGGGLKLRLDAVLEDASHALHDHVDAAMVREILDQHQCDRRQAPRLWAILTFALWLSQGYGG